MITDAALYAGIVMGNDCEMGSAADVELRAAELRAHSRGAVPTRSIAFDGHEMIQAASMERPIDEIRKAEAAMRELLVAASELRWQVDLACVQNPEETAELRKAAASLEQEVQRIKDYLQHWRQSIQ